MDASEACPTRTAGKLSLESARPAAAGNDIMIDSRPKVGMHLETVQNLDAYVNGKEPPSWVYAGTVFYVSDALAWFERPDGTTDVFIWNLRDGNTAFRESESDATPARTT